MNTFDLIRYDFLPAVKAGLIYLYWIIKYGGKKRIPPEVIFKQMAKSMQRMTDNLEQAVQIGHEQLGHHETMQGLKLLERSRNLKDRIEQLRK